MIIALHGFLGLPSDWQTVLEQTAPYRAVDLWSEAREVSQALGGSHDGAFKAWAERFNAQVRSEIAAGAERPILLGYSMGGRLAMHALTVAPELFAGAILISAHPGLQSENEREARRASDHAWAEHFRSHEEWSSVLAEWNAQSVLQSPEKTAKHANAIRFDRSENSFDRGTLAYAMEAWSLGRQSDLRPQLAKVKIPLLYLMGQEDRKFSSLLLEEFAARQGLYSMPDAGHRVPWDTPWAFGEVVREYLEWTWPRQ